jgi:heat shock protein HslJ
LLICDWARSQGDQITFGPIVSALIACPDLQTAQGDAMRQVLMDTASFNIEGDTLAIIENDEVLVFETVTNGS